MSAELREVVKIVDRLADAVLAIANRVDYLDGDMASVIHELAMVKESLGKIAGQSSEE